MSNPEVHTTVYVLGWADWDVAETLGTYTTEQLAEQAWDDWRAGAGKAWGAIDRTIVATTLNAAAEPRS